MTTKEKYKFWGEIIGTALFIAFMAFLIAGCGQPPELNTRVETVMVDRPVRAPCPEPQDVPALPRRVAEDNPAMPADPNEQARILGAKVIELFTFAERALGIMTECSRPGG